MFKGTDLVWMAVFFTFGREHVFPNATWTSEFVSFFKTMFSTVLSLPSGIFWVCIVQFFAWIGKS